MHPETSWRRFAARAALLPALGLAPIGLSQLGPAQIGGPLPPGEASPLQLRAEPAEAEAAAVVLRLQAPNVPSDSLPRPTPHAVGSLLLPGTLLHEPEGGRLLVLLHDGLLHQVEDSARVPDPVGDPDPMFRLIRSLLLRSAEMARADATLDPPALDPPAAEVDARPLPVRPSGSRRVRSLTPLLVWRAADGAAGYRIHLWTTGDQVLSREVGPDTTWTLPVGFPLTPGAEYEWAVASLPGTLVSPRAPFQVAPRPVLDDVARELGRLRERGLDPEGDGLLPAVALYRSMALPYDALDALETLARLGDRRSPELRTLHDRLRAELTEPAPPR